MSEKTIYKLSILTFIAGLLVFILIGLFTHQISFPLGFLVGYIFNAINFYVIIKTVDKLLVMNNYKTIILSHILKLLIYACGFMLAIKFPKLFNLAAVFFGYMVIKVSILIAGFIQGGEKGGTTS